MEEKAPDMKYSLTSLEEPSDEQLAWLMKGVGDEARKQAIQNKEIIKRQIKKALKNSIEKNR